MPGNDVNLYPIVYLKHRGKSSLLVVQVSLKIVLLTEEMRVAMINKRAI